MARGETVNSDAYIKTLQKLKQRYRRVRRNRNPGGMLIQHDNARPHTNVIYMGDHERSKTRLSILTNMRLLYGSYASEFSAGMPDKINSPVAYTDTGFWGLRCSLKPEY